MGIIEDLLNALDRIPIWKRLQELPPEVERLKHRVAELEEKLGDVWPPDVCRLCGKRAARIVNSFTSCKIADNSDPLRGIFASNTDPF